MRNALVVMTVVLGMGCASVGAVQRAQTLGQGNVQVAVEPGAAVARGAVGLYPGGTGLAAAPFTSVQPTVDVAVRYGVTDSVDVGLRAGLSGLEGTSKVLLTRPRTQGLVASLAPSVAWTFTMGTASLPLLVGYAWNEHEVTLGLRVLATLTPSSTTAPVLGVGPGVSLGVSLQLTPWLAVLPEIAVAAAGPRAEDLLLPERWFAQFKVGLELGRRK